MVKIIPGAIGDRIASNRHPSSRLGTNSRIIQVSIRPKSSLQNVITENSINPTYSEIQSLPIENKSRRDTIFQRNHSSLNAARIRTKTTSVLSRNSIQIMKKEDWSSNTIDLIDKSGTRKNKKKSFAFTRRCKWIIVVLIAALIFAAAIAGILAATLMKSDTSIISTTTTTSETTTTDTTVLTTTATTTTVTTAPTTTITSTTSTTVTTTSTTTSTTTTSTTTTTTTTITSTTTTTTVTTTTTSTQSTTVTYTKTTTSTISTTTTVLVIANVVPSNSVSGYSGTETLLFNCSTTITNLTIQIFVLRSYGAIYNSMYATYWGGTMTGSYTTNSTYIIYTWTIVNGQTITCSGGPYTYTAQIGSNGTTQITSGDTYTVTAMNSGGMVNILSGHF